MSILFRFKWKIEDLRYGLCPDNMYV